MYNEVKGNLSMCVLWVSPLVQWVAHIWYISYTILKVDHRVVTWVLLLYGFQYTIAPPSVGVDENQDIYFMCDT